MVMGFISERWIFPNYYDVFLNLRAFAAPKDKEPDNCNYNLRQKISMKCGDIYKRLRCGDCRPMSVEPRCQKERKQVDEEKTR
jgi:hypothetical protein